MINQLYIIRKEVWIYNRDQSENYDEESKIKHIWYIPRSISPGPAYSGPVLSDNYNKYHLILTDISALSGPTDGKSFDLEVKFEEVIDMYSSGEV